MRIIYIILASILLHSCNIYKSSNESDQNLLIRQTIINNSLQGFMLLKKSEKIKKNWRITDEQFIGIKEEYRELYWSNDRSLKKLWSHEIIEPQIRSNNFKKWKTGDIPSNQTLIRKIPKKGKGYCSLTKPIFSRNKEFAVVFYTTVYAPLFAQGFISLYAKTDDGTWIEIANEMKWMS